MNLTLKEWLKKQKDFSELIIRDIFKQMLNAVVYVADNGILHQDIK